MKITQPSVPAQLPPDFAAQMAQSVRLPDDFQDQIARATAGIRSTMARVHTQLQADLRVFRALSRVLQNAPETVAGLEARYYVRAALDPAYDSEDALHGLLVLISHGTEPGLRFLTAENRGLVAAAAIRGWVRRHPERPEVLAWHRLIGTATVVVTRG